MDDEAKKLGHQLQKDMKLVQAEFVDMKPETKVESLKIKGASFDKLEKFPDAQYLESADFKPSMVNPKAIRDRRSQGRFVADRNKRILQISFALLIVGIFAIGIYWKFFS
jgi:hypothetical protein